MPDRPKPPPAPPLKITTLFGQPVIQSPSGMTQSITPITTEPPSHRRHGCEKGGARTG